jgi:NifU-like protein involved in Fe-S cluster formation
MDYSSEVRRRSDAPARAGDISLDGGEVVEGVAEDRSLSVWVRFQIQLQAAVIERARFRCFGCPHTVAAADLLAETIEGQTVSELESLDIEELAAALDVPREKFGKLLRVEDALIKCLEAAGPGITK